MSSFRFLPAILLASALPATAAVYTLEVPTLSSRGWYDSNGTHDWANSNYVAGYYPGGATEYRNYFIFSLAGISPTEQITAVTITMFNREDGFYSTDPAESYQLFDITGVSAATLRQSQDHSALGLSIFEDLGSGQSYSVLQEFTAAANGNIVVIPLNVAFITYAQANLGGVVMMGGRVTTLGPTDQVIFGASDLTPLNSVYLTITTVPEPATPALVAMAAGLAARRRRRASH